MYHFNSDPPLVVQVSFPKISEMNEIIEISENKIERNQSNNNNNNRYCYSFINV